MRARPLNTFPDFLRRSLALGCAALVLLLGIAGSSPALHALAHAHAADTHTHATDSDHSLPTSADSVDTCAIALFAHGVSLTVATVSPAAPAAPRHDLQLPAIEETVLIAPRYLHQPERGPPAV